MACAINIRLYSNNDINGMNKIVDEKSEKRTNITDTFISPYIYRFV